MQTGFSVSSKSVSAGTKSFSSHILLVININTDCYIIRKKLSIHTNNFIQPKDTLCLNCKALFVISFKAVSLKGLLALTKAPPRPTATAP